MRKGNLCWRGRGCAPGFKFVLDDMCRCRTQCERMGHSIYLGRGLGCVVRAERSRCVR